MRSPASVGTAHGTLLNVSQVFLARALALNDCFPLRNVDVRGEVCLLVHLVLHDPSTDLVHDPPVLISDKLHASLCVLGLRLADFLVPVLLIDCTQHVPEVGLEMPGHPKVVTDLPKSVLSGFLSLSSLPLPHRLNRRTSALQLVVPWVNEEAAPLSDLTGVGDRLEAVTVGVDSMRDSVDDPHFLLRGDVRIEVLEDMPTDRTAAVHVLTDLAVDLVPVPPHLLLQVAPEWVQVLPELLPAPTIAGAVAAVRGVTNRLREIDVNPILILVLFENQALTSRLEDIGVLPLLPLTSVPGAADAVRIDQLLLHILTHRTSM